MVAYESSARRVGISARAHLRLDYCTRPSALCGSARPRELSQACLGLAPPHGASSALCYAKCSLDAVELCVRHAEIRTLLRKERADFDLLVSAHARGERTPCTTLASADAEKVTLSIERGPT